VTLLNNELHFGATSEKLSGQPRIKDGEFNDPSASLGRYRTPVNRAFCMVERPQIPFSGGASGCRDQP
jgi:hypothetical protein